jgi:hypothetical protein
LAEILVKRARDVRGQKEPMLEGTDHMLGKREGESGEHF